MEITIDKLTDGKYGTPSNNYLMFRVEKKNLIYIDKKSALEIAHTLIDSLGMLDKDAEELICKMQEKIENL